MGRTFPKEQDKRTVARSDARAHARRAHACVQIDLRASSPDILLAHEHRMARTHTAELNKFRLTVVSSSMQSSHTILLDNIDRLRTQPTNPIRLRNITNACADARKLCGPRSTFVSGWWMCGNDMILYPSCELMGLRACTRNIIPLRTCCMHAWMHA